jgi:hypothetical protein
MEHGCSNEPWVQGTPDGARGWTLIEDQTTMPARTDHAPLSPHNPTQPASQGTDSSCLFLGRTLRSLHPTGMVVMARCTFSLRMTLQSPRLSVFLIHLTGSVLGSVLFTMTCLERIQLEHSELLDHA